MESLKKREIKHLLFSSTSSVYGNNIDFPFSENLKTDSPASLYSATKKSCENLLYYYSHQFKIPTTVMRFFTVYGPWGRPDQALFKFVEKIFNGKEIEIFNEGNMERDFTYIDDLVDCFLQIMKLPPTKTKNLVNDPNYFYRVVNIGSSEKVNLNDFVKHIENKTQIKAQKKYLPNQPGDIYRTQSDNTLLFKIIGERDFMSCSEGIKNFVEWYKKYKKI